MSALDLPPQLPRHIAAKIGGTNDRGCWLWAAAKTNGYGVVQFKGRVRRAHRVVFEMLGGVLIEGLQCDHLCRERSCVNPAHLERHWLTTRTSPIPADREQRRAEFRTWAAEHSAVFLMFVPLSAEGRKAAAQ